MTTQADYRDRQFLAVIGDEASRPPRPAIAAGKAALTVAWEYRILSRACSWPALACVYPRRPLQCALSPSLTPLHRQHVTAPPDNQKNFLVVDAKTDNAAIEAAFDRFTTERKDIGIVLINQHVRPPVPDVSLCCSLSPFRSGTVG